MRKFTIAVTAVLCLVAALVPGQTAKKSDGRTLNVFTFPNGEAVTTTADQPPVTLDASKPIALNDNLALRIEGMHDGRVMGTLVVKVDGRWVDVHLASKNMRAAGR